jgi:protein-disulfide isomerase
MTEKSMIDVDELDHVRGAHDPLVVLVEYGDYECPHTRAAQPIVDRLVAEHRDVRIVFRHFPLRRIHPNAELLSRIAEAAARQVDFWAMHDRLMHHRTISPRDVLADASDARIDMRRVEREIADEPIAARVERDVQSGRASGVHSTPSFFFNGVLHDGHYDELTMRSKLAEARSR